VAFGNIKKSVTMEISMAKADFSGKNVGTSGAIVLAAFLPIMPSLQKPAFRGLLSFFSRPLIRGGYRKAGFCREGLPCACKY
jgi:hypothetical protein